MNITEEELEMLKAVKTGDEWQNACLSIKKNHGGKYPDDWYHKVLKTGLMDSIVRMFGGSSKITVSTRP